MCSPHTRCGAASTTRLHAGHRHFAAISHRRMGMPGTPDFRNAVVSVNTADRTRTVGRIATHRSLAGRVRTDHWTSRTLDLDIIDFDGIVSDDPDSTLPHPRAWQRAFVLGPWPYWIPTPNWSARMPDPWHNCCSNPPIGSTSTSSPKTGWSPTPLSCLPLPVPATRSRPLYKPEAVNIGSNSSTILSSRNPMDSRNLHGRCGTAVPQETSLDGIPGNQVEGISPLYHVSQLDGNRQHMAAVMQISHAWVRLTI